MGVCMGKNKEPKPSGASGGTSTTESAQKQQEPKVDPGDKTANNKKKKEELLQRERLKELRMVTSKINTLSEMKSDVGDSPWYANLPEKRTERNLR